ncbi:MAG TPA: hypothetical protein EYG79_11090 [Rhodobacteraceae bacterium]|nr:hypothetical protein [Paracoccaceae bacterium]
MSKKNGDSRQIQVLFGNVSAQFSIAFMLVGFVLLMMFSLFAAQYAERKWQLDKSDSGAVFIIIFFVLALVLFFVFLIRKAKREHLAAQKNDTER